MTNHEQDNRQALHQALPQYRMTQLIAVLQLLDEGNTVPFIARYRKEKTGSLDEVQIQEIKETAAYLDNLAKRKEEVCRLIQEQGKLTDALQSDIAAAQTLQQVEDLYRPYKQKRRTKATIAKERGLAPLAAWLLQLPKENVEAYAQTFVKADQELPTIVEVLAGAHEIMAEQIGENPTFRQWIRTYTYESGQFISQGKHPEKDERQVYAHYYAFSEPVKKMVSHRILAANRGEKEGILSVSIAVDEQRIFRYLHQTLMKKNAHVPAAQYVQTAYEDSYKRFIAPAIEREIRKQLTEKAEEQAIHLFGENVHHLLLQAPLKGKTVMGFDPAYRTGCKLAIVDETGKVLAIQVIYPHPPASKNKQEQAAETFQQLLDTYQVEMVAIGNGTASRESEQFVAAQLKQSSRTIQYTIVSEAGASVYSASAVARQEFPDLQVEERSAISIARRLQDPLAELIKIDPKAVGVGQYQHDVSQKRLGEQLDFVVKVAVNQVGVNINTASPQLLQHVSGLNKTTAQNIVTFREKNGSFHSRTQVKDVPRLGPKAYEQAIGFLRIPMSQNILDHTSIHPESYPVAKQLLQTIDLPISDLGTPVAKERLEQRSLTDLANTLNVGKETLQDIRAALLQPERDLRDEMSAPLLRTDVLSMEDLQPGMELKGTVRNVTDFGAFVDIGVKQDGLVHVSKLSTRYIKHPSEVVAVGDIVTTWVEAVDVAKARISLTMRAPKT